MSWRRGRLPGLPVVGMIAFLMLVVSVPLTSIYATWADRRAMRSEWAIEGPPCPVVAPPDPAKFERQPLKVFQYGGVSFLRRFGHVSCVSPSEGVLSQRATYRVCQFTAPALVGVNAGENTTYFSTGVGRKATVTVRGGEPSCIIGGWFAG